MKRFTCIATLAWLALASAPAIGAQGSGCLPTTGTVSGLSMAQFINQAFAALISGNSGASAPQTDCSAVPVKGQAWLDTSVTPNVERRYDGNNWVAVGAIDATNHVWQPPIGGGTATVTAASTTDICAAPSAVQNIRGTTTITSFGSNCPVGVSKKLFFGAATPITYNATSMILPGQRDFVAAMGDMADATYLGSGNWRVAVSRIDGSGVVNPSVPLGTVLYGDYATIPTKTVYGNGAALARSSYPDYFATVTRAQTGTLSSGNNTITSVANTVGLGGGMPIEGTGIPSGTTIVGLTSSTIVMSANATVSGSQTVRAFITGYGSGGDSTTVGVKNCGGRVLAGRDPAGVILSNATAMKYVPGLAKPDYRATVSAHECISAIRDGRNDHGDVRRQRRPDSPDRRRTNCQYSSIRDRQSLARHSHDHVELCTAHIEHCRQWLYPAGLHPLERRRAVPALDGSADGDCRVRRGCAAVRQLAGFAARAPQATGGSWSHPPPPAAVQDLAKACVPPAAAAGLLPSVA